MNKYLVLANGNPPAKSVISYLNNIGYNKLICADGGANKALSLKLKPDIIIGDLDSISSKTLRYFKGKSRIIRLKRQNDTDVEKCLKHLISKKINEVILLGVTGDRLDHTFCNLGIVLKFYNKIKITIIAENSVLQPVTGSATFITKSKEIISLYGIDPKTKITTKGLKYSLNNENLPFGIRDGTSNLALGNEITLNVKKGIIFMIRDFNVMKRYGLFQQH
ncbi:MAG: thiamine diphosphokinase [Ignavibacteriales bacterium]|nr:MAG: thiamine diphosphokinase [Ignavibacteriales bacterium]